MPRSLILGVNGQDGSFLAEELLRRGHEVVGIGRDPQSRYVAEEKGFSYRAHDLRDAEGLVPILADAAPDHVFHFAAVHGAAGFRYEPVWRDMLAVNVASLHVLLEHARLHAPAMRVIYAGSSKVFPAPLSGVIDEDTEKRATCLYGIGKMTARDLLLHYRAHHGIAVTNLIFFNHESARRPPGFFLTELAAGLGAALEDGNACMNVRTLDFRIDWSAADELMGFVADIAMGSNEAEFVMASGRTVHAREAVRILFERQGLDYRRHVRETSGAVECGPDFRVSIKRLERAVGRVPAKDVAGIVDDMLAARRLAKG
jgi:GDPmannose 4,6-dehydratase